MTTATGQALTVNSYTEVPASPCLADFIECYWVQETAEPRSKQLVFPDGCADILFSNPKGCKPALFLVGAMTRAQAFDVPRGLTFGVRFRPGMSSCFVRVPGQKTANNRLLLEDIWSDAKSLCEKLANARGAREVVSLIETDLNQHLNANSGRRSIPSPTQRLLCWAARERGDVRIEDLADIAGLSSRQLRRQCLDLTGLTPKQLCRTLRFRHAAAAVMTSSPGEWADLALDFGYYDQSHFINEFRAFCDLTPGEYRAR